MPGTPRGTASSGQSTLSGIARDGKGGPAVIVDGAPVYVMRLRAWPESWVGKRVVVTGRVATRQGLPRDTTMGGMVGPYRVIERASWRLADTAPHPALVFEYAASDGQFSYSLELYDDRTWSRSEHSGTATPRGRLSRAAMRRFEALLRAAPFDLEPRECADDSREWAENAPNEEARSAMRAWATFTDASRDRSVRAEPCFAADAITHRLLDCLEVLVAREDSKDACRLDRSPSR